MTKIEEMMEYCDINQLFWFCDLADYASKKRSDWFRTLATQKGSKIMGSYLSVKAYKAGLLTNEQYAEWENED